jgi:hypothetical protein
MSAGQSHAASAAIAKPAEEVIAFMADSQKLNRWSFGTWETEIAADDLVKGTSIFDGSITYVRIASNPSRHEIDYHLGLSPEKLVPRIMARVVPGDHLGLETGTCVLTLLAWRSASMSDERWQRLTTAHDFEVILIKNLLENGRV